MPSFHLFDYQDLISRVSEGHPRTCSWLRDDPLFVRWKDPRTSENWLWVHSPPGTGKSVLAKYVYQHFAYKAHKSSSWRSHDGNPKALACYLFCFEDDEQAKSPRLLLASIIHQLLLQDSSLAEALEQTYKVITFKEINSLWNLWDIFSIILNGLGPRHLFIVIDALDEMEIDLRESFLRKLRQTIPVYMRTVRIFFTSRREPDLEKMVETWQIPHLTLGTGSQGNQDDLSFFLKSTIQEYGRENFFEVEITKSIYK